MPYDPIYAGSSGMTLLGAATGSQGNPGDLITLPECRRAAAADSAWPTKRSPIGFLSGNLSEWPGANDLSIGRSGRI
jgi:hypothetical protein